MECSLLEGTSQGGTHPLCAFERHVRRRKILIYRPAPEEHGSPTLQEKHLEIGGTSLLPCGAAGWSPSKRQRLQKGSPPMAKRNESPFCGAGESLWRVASPMEKKQRRVLAVDLEDLSITKVPGDPQRCSSLRGLAISPCINSCQPVITKADGASCSTKGQSSTTCSSTSPKRNSTSPKGASLSHEEPQENWSHVCRQLWDQRQSPSCRETERLQVKRQRLQNGFSPVSKTEAISMEGSSLSRALDAGAGMEQLETSPPPCRSDRWILHCHSPSSHTDKPTPPDLCENSHQTDVSSEAAKAPSSWPPSTSTFLRPSVVPRFQHWGLAPVFQSVRSKLEAFTDIFLSPSKPALPSTEGPPSLTLGSQKNEDQAAAQLGTPHRRVNIEVKIAISEPHPRKRSCHQEEEEEEEMGSLVVSGRPPISQWRLNEGDPAPQPRLGRSYSCPDFPGARSWQDSPVAISPSSQQRQRRHTVCSLEVSRELGRPTPPCLRKEVYPFSTPPARFLAHSVSGDSSSYTSPVPSCCRDSDPTLSRNLSTSPDGGQRVPGVGLGLGDSELVTSEQMILAEDELKVSQDNTTGKVSCIRIRKTPARQQANLTPMGLPRPVRLNKKEFSLEEIYTNKNYRTPTEKRSFETIFEVPLERNGALIFTSQRKLKRAVEFREGGLPRKQRKARTRGGRKAGGRRAQPQPPELEERLRQRLAELDALFEDE
ncbi:proline-rich protein 14 isoform X2 [Sceloporus undulatus]|nr:proline-rich protein 14 isoform X2 [Sceloporus undulatus]XP_042331822.1 proline-rich protein 14 isoform X2 [Sceloporus undulatus]XP_042331823.1 proline-rich protein 14 isoform X2 [Sceloporus undulatus]XP_042331824.1 proline-rich protein 14 isoform X2 [Sceloporus undulatus]XP_042331825.1 proline-rich protein 14 isoform X2 [Sceloporus undulatus]